MHLLPSDSALHRAVASGRRLADGWGASPRAQDVVTALSCLGLMALDLPGLAAADNSLNGWQAAFVLTAGCATCWCGAGCPGRRTSPPCCSSAGCTS